MKKLFVAFLIVVSLGLRAQVPLGGHTYVPSTTDSNAGQTNVVMTDADCTLTSQTGCTAVDTSNYAADAPYLGTLNVTSSVALTSTHKVNVVASPGRHYTVLNRTTGGQTISVCALSSCVAVPNGSGPSIVVSDGSALYAVANSTISKIIYSQPGDTLDSLSSRCGSLPCQIVVTQPQTLTLSANYTLPSNISVQFVNGGIWTVNGAFTLTMGSVAAPESAQVFAGTATIAGLGFARPEWFSSGLIDGSIPSTATVAAYNALNAQGTLAFRVGNYLMPSSGLNITKFINLVGAGKAQLDADIPTRYVDGTGTILQGSVFASSANTMRDLSIDRGPWVTANKFGGTTDFGLFLAEGDHTMINHYRGVIWRNLGVLTQGTANDSVHTVLLENAYQAVVDGMEITTVNAASTSLGGTYGLIVKSSASKISNIHVKGASGASILCKSDWATFADGNCQNNTFDGIWVDSFLSLPNSSQPIVYEAFGDNIYGNTWTNVHTNSFAGVYFQTAGSNTISVESWSNFSMNVAQVAFYAGSGNTVNGATFANGNVLDSSTALGAFQFQTGSQSILISNVTVTGTGSNAINGAEYEGGVLGGMTVIGMTCQAIGYSCVHTTDDFAHRIQASNITAITPTTGQVFNDLSNPNLLSAALYQSSGGPITFLASGNGTTAFWDASNNLGGHFWTMDSIGNETINTVNAAAGFKFNGTGGFTGTKTAGTCVMTIQGGIITNVTGC